MTVQGLPVESAAEPTAEWAAIERFEPGQSNAAVIGLASVAALGGFLFGYDSAVINGAVKAIGAHFGAAAGTLGFAVASALLGAAVGALVAGVTEGLQEIGTTPSDFVQLDPEVEGMASEANVVIAVNRTPKSAGRAKGAAVREAAALGAG